MLFVTVCLILTLAILLSLNFDKFAKLSIKRMFITIVNLMLTLYLGFVGLGLIYYKKNAAQVANGVFKIDDQLKSE